MLLGLGLVRPAEHILDHAREIGAGVEGPRPGDAARHVPVVGIVAGIADVVADFRVDSPGAPERRVAQGLRHALAQESGDVALGRQAFARRQRRQLFGRKLLGRKLLGARRRLGATLGRLGRRGLLGLLDLELAPRPARQELAAHGSSSPGPMRRRRPIPSGSARSRWRLMNGRSTWNAAKNAATLAWISGGIGTASTTSPIASAMDSPS